MTGRDGIVIPPCFSFPSSHPVPSRPVNNNVSHHKLPSVPVKFSTSHWKLQSLPVKYLEQFSPLPSFPVNRNRKLPFLAVKKKHPTRNYHPFPPRKKKRYIFPRPKLLSLPVNNTFSRPTRYIPAALPVETPVYHVNTFLVQSRHGDSRAKQNQPDKAPHHRHPAQPAIHTRTCSSH